MIADRAEYDQSQLRARTAQLNMQLDHYYVELPLELLDDQGSLLDSVIAFTFDTLQIQHLDLRILPLEGV
ncbi:MAG TPA: hypothetical protein VFU22_28545 [Roseiflexaceae bacterium]|nr:hypothetical protein [Roseiflexaceae bacterium]